MVILHTHRFDSDSGWVEVIIGRVLGHAHGSGGSPPTVAVGTDGLVVYEIEIPMVEHEIVQAINGLPPHDVVDHSETTRGIRVVLEYPNRDESNPKRFSRVREARTEVLVE